MQRPALIPLLVTLALGCASDDTRSEAPRQPGTLALTITGGDFIQSGSPEGAFADGWTVTYDRFLVSLASASVGVGGQAVVTLDLPRVLDLAKPSADGVELASAEVEGGTFTDVGYRIAPASGATQPASGATAADVDDMRQGGYSVLVEGKAVKGAITKSFRWGFTTDTVYTACETEAQVDGGRTAVAITIQADHLYHDSLEPLSADVRFDLMAGADKDNDGKVTQAELTAVDIRGATQYQSGDAGAEDLWAYLNVAVPTLGHIDGEGHCAAAPGGQ